MEAAKLEKILPKCWEAAGLKTITYTNWFKIAYQMAKKGIGLPQLASIFKNMKTMKTKPKSPEFLIKVKGNRMVFEILNDAGEEGAVAGSVDEMGFDKELWRCIYDKIKAQLHPDSRVKPTLDEIAWFERHRGLYE